MAVATGTLSTSATVTDAEFRTFLSTIFNVLESGGVLKTADTGQINLTTVAFPAVNSTEAGYEIRRFSDSEQTTTPVFMKIEAGRGTTAGLITWRLTIGTGSDGAGNITGVKHARTAQFNINGTADTSQPYWISAGTGRFVFSINMDTSSSGFFFSLERTINSDRTPNNKGVLLWYKGTQTGGFHHFVNFQGTSPAVETVGGCLAPNNQTTGLHSNGNVSVYPHFFFGIGEVLVPGTNFVGVFLTDFTQQNQYTVNILGVNQNMVFLPIGVSGAGISPFRGNPSVSQGGIMMRYE